MNKNQTQWEAVIWDGAGETELHRLILTGFKKDPQGSFFFILLEARDGQQNIS